MTYQWHWSVFLERSPEENGTYLDTLLLGLQTTLATAAAAWILALALGSLVGILGTLPSKSARVLTAAYVELFRNVPLLVQLFLWYFVLPEMLPFAVGSWLKQLPDASFVTAVIGIGFFMSARVAEGVRAGIEALPAGQRLAGAALGLTTAQVYRHVLLPQAFRLTLPPLTSELLNTIKNTSVALAIGLAEVMARARAMQEFSFQVFEAFTAATLIYLAINLVVTLLMRALERRVAMPGSGSGPP
ncbi:amino acid ABC transporter permease [Salinarimonas soli]|uniref:Amino acid ABC transporter permease n=1 Tax=Salinarimonas soli TaxID=1638099 RepID=A0A5B2VH46_9HYPH|nr:amino acid ABC transporter permease [Salinarimonas soli]KAA2238265.1 amino acid ABC transporter permease [Salinarimonas soli]